jgi:Domain of unknown function (DUF4878)
MEKGACTLKLSTIIVIGGLIALNYYIFNELYQSIQSVQTNPLVVDSQAKNPLKTDLFHKNTENNQDSEEVLDKEKIDQVETNGVNTPSKWSSDVLIGEWEGIDRFGMDGFLQLHKDGLVEMVLFGESFRGSYTVKDANITPEAEKALIQMETPIPKTIQFKVENRKNPLEYKVQFISKNKFQFVDSRGESIIVSRNGYPVPRNTAEERVIDFLQHLTKGELTEAYEFLTEMKQETMGGTSEVVLQELILGDRAERMLNFHIRSVNADEKTGTGTAQVEVTVRYTTVKSTKLSTILLEKVGGYWRISGFQA